VKPFPDGARVKLTDRYAQALCKAKKNKIDWLTRRGVVGWCGKDAVAIAWPGRQSLDMIPIKAVELAQ
jgi:hypothetical protein